MSTFICPLERHHIKQCFTHQTILHTQWDAITPITSTRLMLLNVVAVFRIFEPAQNVIACNADADDDG